jgi:hypothetical protein
MLKRTDTIKNEVLESITFVLAYPTVYMYSLKREFCRDLIDKYSIYFQRKNWIRGLNFAEVIAISYQLSAISYLSRKINTAKMSNKYVTNILTLKAGSCVGGRKELKLRTVLGYSCR